MGKHHFELRQERPLAEFNARAFLFGHRSGAELLSLVCDDENKVFGINFRTPPRDATGVAHILEHSVLCGSRKYPLKEPFVELLKGSLKTFLNAFTYPDRTCYPVASQNVRDFYNLVDVYLDAVFYPRLTPQVLQQEGWHYELEALEAPLSYKGVVFNEMKGAYSSPERVLAETVQHSLFPDTIYGVDSGGDPRHIPELSWEQFAAFHQEYYHPANARIFFYGDDDPERRLLLLEDYLKDFAPREIHAGIAAQPRFARPRRLERTYAAGQEGESSPKSMAAVNWLLEAGLHSETLLGLQILDYLLLGTPASPLRKALIDSGLGEDLAGGGLESELYQLFFSVGLKGVEPGREQQIEPLVLESLERLAGGLEAGQVAAALNTSEFRLRENNTGSYPRGLVLMLRALTSWLYGGDPLAPLCFEAPLAAIKTRLEQGEPYFENLLRSHLLDNPHRTTLVLRPDPEQGARLEAEERARLERARAGMSRRELQEVAAAARELRRRQEAPDPPEALAALPRLHLSDLEPRIRPIPLEVHTQRGVPVLYHELFTNGIVYLDLGFELRVLPRELLPYVPLFGRALLEMGTEKEDFVRLAQRIGARTGGIWSQPLLSARRGEAPAVARLFWRAKATLAQAGDLLAILREVLLEARLDARERFLQMVLEEKAGEEAALIPAGHGVVSTRLRAAFSEVGWIAEQMEGVSYLFFLRRLVREIEADWPAVRARLEELRRLLIHREGLLCNLTLAAGDRAAFSPQLEELIAALPRRSLDGVAWEVERNSACEGLLVPAQVNYVAKGGNLYDLGYELHGSAAVVTRFLRTTWLWDRVRVQGGAYGASCSFDALTGVFSCVSYRDPNLLETLAIYDEAGAFLRRVDLSAGELARAIIGTIGDLDAYQLPDAKGHTSMVRHLAGIDDEYRQQRRDEVLGTTAAHFRAFGEVLERAKETGRVVVMGAPKAIEAANGRRPDWLRRVRVL